MVLLQSHGGSTSFHFIFQGHVHIAVPDLIGLLDETPEMRKLAVLLEGKQPISSLKLFICPPSF